MCEFQTKFFLPFFSTPWVFSIIFVCCAFFLRRTRQHRQKNEWDGENKWERTTMANGGLFRNKIFVIKLINDCLSNEKLLKVFFFYRFLPSTVMPQKPIWGRFDEKKKCVEIWLRYLMFVGVILQRFVFPTSLRENLKDKLIFNWCLWYFFLHVKAKTAVNHQKA